MTDITNELPTAPAKPAPKKHGYRTQKDAKDAAVAELGEFARHGFEFETTKCDGRWIWVRCDEVKPPTHADLKASGGRKAAKADAAARKADQDRHEQRGAERAAAEGRLRTDLTIPADGSIPAFLKRAPETAEAKKARQARLAKADPGNPERIIKNPPDAKVAKARAKKRAAGSKTALIGSMLLDPKGCTTADILAQTGWPSVSVPAQAKAVGLKLTKKKDGKVTRYWGHK